MPRSTWDWGKGVDLEALGTCAHFLLTMEVGSSSSSIGSGSSCDTSLRVCPTSADLSMGVSGAFSFGVSSSIWVWFDSSPDLSMTVSLGVTIVWKRTFDGDVAVE